MGSSYRSDLNGGSMREWEEKLRDAHRLIKQVRDEVSSNCGEDGQFDNAADDGALYGRLGVCLEIIAGELPAANGGSERQTAP